MLSMYTIEYRSKDHAAVRVANWAAVVLVATSTFSASVANATKVSQAAIVAAGYV